MSDTALSDRSRSFDAFLSYAREDDSAFRDALVAGLAREGLRIWFDRESMPNRGTTFDQEIRRAIESSARLVLVVGPRALTSEYVAQEWGFADDLGLPVVPVLQAGAFDDLPERLRGYHSVDARRPGTVEVALRELVRLLSEPVLPLGMCHRVPLQPPHELGRPDLLERLWRSLGLDRQRPQEAGRAPRGAALYGMSGAGKSTVAATFARSTRSRRSFPDGIVWLVCGPSFQALAGARELLGQVAPGARLPGRADEVGDALAEGLGRREVLVVLDDVREADGAAAFMGALGPGGRALLTTLDQAVATALGVPDIAVGELDDAAARHLLEGWAGESLPSDADAVVAACAGLPFALAIVGAMVRNRVGWNRVVQALEAHRLDLLEARFPSYPHPNLLRALAASYHALAANDPRSAECYLELAAFRPGALLTESVIVRLWSRPSRLSRVEAALVLPVLERRLLIQRRSAGGDSRFSLHRLHEDFVRLECPNRPDLEASLVASYRAEKGSADWSSLPDDGYVYDHLIAHLAALGDGAELSSVVSAGWIRRQLLLRGDLGQALDDVRRALEVSAAVRPDIPTITGLALLAGQVAATLRGAPASLIGAMAEAGDIEQALRWAADKPDPAERFEALVVVAEALIRRGEVAVVRRVIRTAAATIPLIGRVVETGMFPGLTALNAVHALVDFPYPDQWEGTDDENVALAKVPIDAVVRLAPVAGQAGALTDLATVSHPFWELYGHLIPLVAVEELADQGDLLTAAALLDAGAAPTGDDDPAHAARYRHAVATASVGKFDVARAAVETLPESYRTVGYRGVARHLAAAGRLEEAQELIDRINDATVAAAATTDLVEATIARAEPASCQRVAQQALERDWAVGAAWLLAAGGDPRLGLELLERVPPDHPGLALGLGLRLGEILRRRGQATEAAETARRLVPMAVRLLGPQWFAPETVGASPEDAALGRQLLSLLARTGEALPDGITPLALIVEQDVGEMPAFKFQLILALAAAGRVAEARELADTSLTSQVRTLGLASAIAVADPEGAADERRLAAHGLTEAVDEIAPSPILDDSLGSAMRALIRGGLHDDAGRLAERLLSRPGLWSAVGAWALDRARAGQVNDVRELVRRLLVERPLQVPDARARALVLSAVAGRRSRPGDELEAAAALLSNVRVAAAALDVVFNVVDLYGRQKGLAAAGMFASGVPGGRAGPLLEELARGGSLRWDGDLSEQELAAAAGVRAVAAASMAIATSRDGSRRQARTWLLRGEGLAAQAKRIAPHLGIAAAIGKYLGAARVEIGDAQATDKAEDTLEIAWVLWRTRRSEAAARYARRALNELGDPLRAGPKIQAVGEFERRNGVFSAARAGLGAIVAMGAAARGDTGGAKAAAGAAAAATVSFGWLALTPAEQAEVKACVAVGLRRAGEAGAAAEQLDQAIAEAVTLARRGELKPFGWLCQALFELRPPDQAIPVWAEWLISAAAAGADEALGLIAACVPWLPETSLVSVTVIVETGQLRSQRPT